jgi:hypothetical protein
MRGFRLCLLATGGSSPVAACAVWRCCDVWLNNSIMDAARQHQRIELFWLGPSKGSSTATSSPIAPASSNAWLGSTNPDLLEAIGGEYGNLAALEAFTCQ